jgi:hypothetical protein
MKTENDNDTTDATNQRMVLMVAGSPPNPKLAAMLERHMGSGVFQPVMVIGESGALEPMQYDHENALADIRALRDEGLRAVRDDFAMAGDQPDISPDSDTDADVLTDVPAKLVGDWTGATTESIALIANNNGKGVVVVSCGDGISYFAEACGPYLSDMGLDDAPHGLTIWEGRVVSSYSPLDGDHDAELVGSFRALTDAEWGRLAATGAPWALASVNEFYPTPTEVTHTLTGGVQFDPCTDGDAS